MVWPRSINIAAMEADIMHKMSRRRAGAKAIEAGSASPVGGLPLRVAAFLLLSALSALLLALPYVNAQ
jgi:hypothetical protein